MCEFCEQFEQLPKMHGKHIFTDGTLRFCEFTELGTGISWRNIGEIRMDFIPINFCPKCGRALRKENTDGK